MFDPHPPLTGFPIVLLVSVTWFELLAIRRSCRQNLKQDTVDRLLPHQLLLFLCAIIPFTYLTGYLTSNQASATFLVPEAAIMKHQSYALALLLMCVPLVLLSSLERTVKRRALRYAYYLCLAVTLSFAVFTSRLGGSLVFDYGAGVSPKREAGSTF